MLYRKKKNKQEVMAPLPLTKTALDGVRRQGNNVVRRQGNNVVRRQGSYSYNK